MDTLVQGYSKYLDEMKFNQSSIPAPSNQNHVNAYESHHGYTHLSDHSNGSLPADESPTSDLSSEGSIPEEQDIYDGVIKYMNQMLMEDESLENKPCMFHECSALQATEKSFYEVIGEKYSPSPDQHRMSSVDNDDFAEKNTFESARVLDQAELEAFLRQPFLVDDTFQPNSQPFVSPGNFYSVAEGLVNSPVSTPEVLDSSSEGQFVSQWKVTHFPPSNNYDVRLEEEDNFPNGSRGKKKHYREEGSDYAQEMQSNKQLASYAEESEESTMYDEVLLWDESDEASRAKNMNKLQPKRSNAAATGKPRGRRQGSRKEVVDLRSLLTQCAQAVSSGDTRNAEELLKKIRQHSSPHGDGIERVAHYFANAIEARLAGTGMQMYTAFTARRIMAVDVLTSYQVYIKACPFVKMSNIFANKSIGKVAAGAMRLHIIDFGIMYGQQWPSLIQYLSMRTGGPPKLRITGIDIPQPGFRPTERVEDSGRRLANYCKRFNVPFEYNAIAKRWDSIKLEDLEIDRDEMVIVNCLYRLRNVPDETVVANSPRDAVLNLIKRINPRMFMHGVINGTYNAPFFFTRFREALFHFSTLFDMFDATVEREDENRLLYEQEMFARDAMNVIACEGTARIERPETYKQWQVRNTRAGFKQMPLEQEIVKDVRQKVRLSYHKDFVVDEDSNWMLQGWKGRVIYALSCWKPIQE